MTRITNAPDASALMESARSFGNYDLAAALADVIDNAITAESRNIDITCDYGNGSNCSVRIRDDGKGMSKDDLIKAMCPASTHPSKRRAIDDLGRFGWGLKSASFSQCRVLTVVSRTAEGTFAARWDLDNISGWQMDLFEGAAATELLNAPFSSKSGTELIWTRCDRLSERGALNREQFSEAIYIAQRRLAQVYHRFLSGDGLKRSKLAIRLNGLALQQVDPFCTHLNATQAFAEEPIEITTGGETHIVTMQAFVLPHYSKLTAKDYEDFGGEDGYIRNQGFYVYRNKRLIISGTWFGLARYGELSKLVRIRIDIPNSLDEIWKITVDKSDAQLPTALRARMKELVRKFRASSHRVHRDRGVRIDATTRGAIWERRVRNGVIRYSFNSEHPLLGALKNSLNGDQEELLTAFLEMAETHMPIDAIARETSTDGDAVQRSFLSREEVVDFLSRALPGLMVAAGSPGALIAILQKTEPFASNWNVTEAEIRRMFPHV